MSLASDLLNSLSDDEIALYTAEPETEGHIVIDKNRFITVPEALKRIGVMRDHRIETVTFDCPRYWDGHDLSKMKMYVNYMRSDGHVDRFPCEYPTVDEADENLIHFDWEITSNVTAVSGMLSFLACAVMVDDNGVEERHWNSELNQEMYVSAGLEVTESILTQYPDVITHLLLRMDAVEALTTEEALHALVNSYMDAHPEVVLDRIKEIATPEALEQYVNGYLTENPLVFVIGSEQPAIQCLWFNTSDSLPSDTMNLTSELGGVYAEVDGEDTPVYDFDII